MISFRWGLWSSLRSFRRPQTPGNSQQGSDSCRVKVPTPSLIRRRTSLHFGGHLGDLVGLMPKPNPKVLLKTATNYLRKHPEEIARAVRGALGLRLGLPLDALRYLAEQFAVGKKAPKDVVIDAVPPGLRVAATVRAMGATIRACLSVFVEELALGSDEAQIAERIADMELEVLEGEDTPVAGLVKSGALDLSKPGNLVAFMPKRPDALVDAKDDRVVVDLLKIPALAGNEKLRRIFAVLTPVVNIQAIRTRDDHLDVHLRVSPQRIPEAVAAVTRG